jgi:sulfur carrier protein
MSSVAIDVVINGKNEKISESTTLKQLLELKGINPNVVACEVNMTIIKRANLSQVVLKEGDHVEIIQMIGGG